MNALLSTIGESPVDTLLGLLPADAGAALAVLRRFSRQLQGRGWSFNSESRARLLPTTDGEVPLPANTLKVDPCDPAQPYVQRGMRLYDPTTRSFAIGAAVEVDLVVALAFEDLPETARAYILAAAARRFQDQYLGDTTLHTFTERDEHMAYAQFLSDEAGMDDLNVLSAAPTPARILRRGK